ncbi:MULTISPECIES: CaiB/BaiF CoA transferase family protein [unclassified Campylobacter]|uniref:CaiB/BaiF CoA transferase family protein n=1 Tax=unclassified Campylobacter TaxID=2593542 RepID=UPI001BD9D234|nr:MULTISPECIES: CaiB/BaiF CoA-transferase family protein [unclassified Campylobacter]MBZ7983565.1 CoA transferase [Campylobacter sp. RM12647]MBZ7990647.1 CoA transferase [Campylobacter sp. RM9331]MBZ8004714.1 CoA transferase [Campylobacter sp. RM9332]MBT0878476.1 CoA transferase [Campylobacter sp. 2018MI01]MBT0882320.1 CoA transferase [Campylobacter sp. 2018MI13]
MLPLEGKLVLSIEQAIAAPFCTRQLADLGARVIKIERPDVGDLARGYDTRVDGLASHFVWTNRSKESLAIDLKTEEGMKIIKSILPKVDIFVQNLAFGAAKRLGLDYENLIKYNPKMIVCDISGYGEGGEYEHKKAYDLLIQSESGLVSITGNGDECVKVPISIADISAGMYAYSGILQALLYLEKTNKGSRIEISMLECMAEWMGYPIYYTYKGANPPIKKGAFHASITPYGPYKAGDGNVVMFGLQNEREWSNFCKIVLEDESLINDEEFKNNTLRTKNAQKIKEIIENKFKNLTAKDVVDRLEKAKIANGNVNELKDVWNHSQLKSRNRWREVDTEVGKIPALLPPATNNNYEPRMDKIPALGEHTHKILKEFGFKDEISQLQSKNIIKVRDEN